MCVSRCNVTRQCNLPQHVNEAASIISVNQFNVINEWKKDQQDSECVYVRVYLRVCSWCVSVKLFVFVLAASQAGTGSHLWVHI